jgi:hypothetical protein
MTQSSDTGLAAGVAALAICEALLLELGALKVLSAKGVTDVLHDAADAHGNGDPRTHSEAVHTEAAAIIKAIIASMRTLPLP